MSTSQTSLRWILAGLYLAVVALVFGVYFVHKGAPPWWWLPAWPDLLYGVVGFVCFTVSQVALLFGWGSGSTPVPIWRRLLPTLCAGVLYAIAVVGLALCADTFVTLPGSEQFGDWVREQCWRLWGAEAEVFCISLAVFGGLNALFWSAVFLIFTRKAMPRQAAWRLWAVVAVTGTMALLSAIPTRMIATQRGPWAIGTDLAVKLGVVVVLWALGGGLGLLLTSPRWQEVTQSARRIWLALGVCLVLLSAVVAWFGLYGDKYIATYWKMGGPFH
jgi:hypothetical protein